MNGTELMFCGFTAQQLIIVRRVMMTRRLSRVDELERYVAALEKSNDRLSLTLDTMLKPENEGHVSAV